MSHPGSHKQLVTQYYLTISDASAWQTYVLAKWVSNIKNLGHVITIVQDNLSHASKNITVYPGIICTSTPPVHELN